MTAVTIFHNPRCSKSRQTLQLLQEQGIEPEVRLYLEQIPAAEELKALLAKLGIDARALLRTKETEYKELNLADKTLTDDEIIAAMTHAPKLIERPIVISGSKAAIGRPPENVLAIL